MIPIIGGFETTYLLVHDRDVAETTEHDIRWRDDLALLRAAGVNRLRYPVRWHRIEEREGEYDWRQTDEVMGHLHDGGFEPIVDLVHHTSYPRWLTDGFADPRFGPAYLRFAEAVARRYPWITEHTAFNEPFSTLFLAGHEAIWPPYQDGVAGFVGLIQNVLPSVASVSRMYRDLLPGCRHVYVDTCEHHHARAGSSGAESYAAMANDRRFFVTDLFLGRTDRESRFVPLVLAAGGERLFDLEPDVLVFDVMDDLTSFKDAPPQLVARHRDALARADVVFAGGRSLHDGVVGQRPDAHLFPSGVEPEHHSEARLHRGTRTTPVAGYVGVLDERLDLELLRGLAAELPDWEIQLVGPVAKIDRAALPTADNIRYLGAQPYERLPVVMGGFDVALMPFALNEATRSISSTKTLEYLAAGLPVVSTRVPDVVADYDLVVDLQDDAAGFADACRRVLLDSRADRDAALRPLLATNHWDAIADRMGRHIETALVHPTATEVPA